MKSFPKPACPASLISNVPIHLLANQGQAWQTYMCTSVAHKQIDRVRCKWASALVGKERRMAAPPPGSLALACLDHSRCTTLQVPSCAHPRLPLRGQRGAQQVKRVRRESGRRARKRAADE